MSSNINPYNIDGTFPVAGQDNSSQGFRDNFTNTKNNFVFAQSEISDLQAKVVVTSALNGQTINNDLAGTQLRRPQLAAWTQSLIDLGAIANAVALDFNIANFQKFTTAGDVSLNFINWPATTGSGALGYGIMRVWINVTDVSHAVTLPSTVSVTVTDIAGYDSATHTITFDHPDNYVFDFSSVDGGTTFLIFDVTRNRATFRDSSFYFNSTVAPALYIGFNSPGLASAQQIEPDADSLNIHEGMNAISAGNLWTASPNSPLMNFSEIPGYHMYAARGNIDQGNISTIRNGDWTGYVTSRGFTGNAGGNVWQNLSSIQFSAAGTDIVNGVGGNVSIWTAPNGVASTNRMIQAVGIENDQSTTFYGNVTVAGHQEVAGYFKTDSGIIEGGTYVRVITTGSTVTANASISTLVIDSSLSSTLAATTVVLPSNPVDRQTIKIVSACPITNANVWAPASALVKWVPANTFSAGNTAVSLTYMSSYASWYRS